MPTDLIKSVDGATLQRMAEAAKTWLQIHQGIVDALNVFPIPDGDTGKNMLLAMQAGCDQISDSSDNSAGRVAHDIAEGALLDARGNSGMILSQIWSGMACSLKHLDSFGTAEFTAAMGEATETAYRAVQEPMEGTMLTVIKDAAEEASTVVEDADDMVTYLERVVRSCECSVERTPMLLPILKQAGVVDAGGFGLLLVFEGMLRYLRGDSLEDPIVDISALMRLGVSFTEEQKAHVASLMKTNKLSEPQALVLEIGKRVESLGLSVFDPRQEWEIIFDLRPRSDLDLEPFYSQLATLGTSIQVGQGEELTRVHIHLETPKRYEPIELAEKIGTVVKVHMENLLDQLYKPGQLVAVVVSPGPGFRSIFSGPAVSVVSGGQTMNPSVQDLLKAFEDLPGDQVILLPNNKNIQMSAEQAAKISAKQVLVLPTRTVPQGINAMLAFRPDGELDDVYENMYMQIAEVETGEVTTATRSVTLDGVTVQEGQVIGLHNGLLSCASHSAENCALELLRVMDVEELELVTLYYGDGIEERAAEALAEKVHISCPEIEVEVYSGGQQHYHYIMSAE